MAPHPIVAVVETLAGKRGAMKTVIPGHLYKLDQYDTGNPVMVFNEDGDLRFMGRVGEMYPGNEVAFSGTNLQEVLRACIDRLVYLQKQKPHRCNLAALTMLRASIFVLEERAAEQKGRVVNACIDVSEIEKISTCLTCGHIDCPGHSG